MNKLIIIACLLSSAIAAPRPDVIYSSYAPLARFSSPVTYAYSSPIVYPSYLAPLSSYSSSYSFTSLPYSFLVN
ncbi:unnamed protein product [Arctia plantaginis]|uniref:Uncharacterized protein n=1 Tax=Arctia plantaginis TaxID=874455 RepID=A0A8S1BMB5_ARCPL|nr:unnamed protein product [Arctia plantaginis]